MYDKQTDQDDNKQKVNKLIIALFQQTGLTREGRNHASRMCMYVNIETIQLEKYLSCLLKTVTYNFHDVNLEVR